MKKIVLKLDVNDEKCKQKVMKSVSRLSGVESISIDMKDQKLTVTGTVDPVEIVNKLKKFCFPRIVSVGPAKEEKKKEEPKKEEPKKEVPKKPDPPSTRHLNLISSHYVAPNYPYPVYNVRSTEEDPTACVIC